MTKRFGCKCNKSGLQALKATCTSLQEKSYIEIVMKPKLLGQVLEANNQECKSVQQTNSGSLATPKHKYEGIKKNLFPLPCNFYLLTTVTEDP